MHVVHVPYICMSMPSWSAARVGGVSLKSWGIPGCLGLALKVGHVIVENGGQPCKHFERCAKTLVEFYPECSPHWIIEVCTR